MAFFTNIFECNLWLLVKSHICSMYKGFDYVLHDLFKKSRITSSKLFFSCWNTFLTKWNQILYLNYILCFCQGFESNEIDDSYLVNSGDSSITGDGYSGPANYEDSYDEQVDNYDDYAANPGKIPIHYFSCESQWFPKIFHTKCKIINNIKMIILLICIFFLA